ncbi:poly-ribose polymerase-like protein [Lasiosphaeria hispida]|uniref:Poly [ADP-ribose] polymerase n=1 Tax=Lasiosphaeria hispida TaxID=260671 RepID=A0AAJ0MIP5_9PEZI|nr:poly-ribose polymerase-like protein [Lasiosphaeria hispida]
MPPKNATRTAAGAGALANCIIAFSGKFPGLTHAILKKQAEGLGAKVSSTVSNATTHLIATKSDYLTTSSKVSKAKDLGIPIIALQWLTNTAAKQAREPEAKYAFASMGDEEEDEEDEKDEEDEEDEEDGEDGEDNAQQSTSRKRSHAEMEDAETKGNAAKKAGAATETSARAKPKPKRKEVHVPLDEHCPFANCTVLIGSAGMVYDAALNQTNASANNNKFYRIQLLADSVGTYRVWTRWGRVGERGQTGKDTTALPLEAAIRLFDKKFKDKTGLPWLNRNEAPKPGKYVYVERNYTADSDEEDSETEDIKDKTKAADWEPPKSTLIKPIQDLMSLIFNTQFFNATMSDLNYDANKLPLGKLSKGVITRGFQALKDLSDLLDNQTLAQSTYGKAFPAAVEDLSNSFYSLIPHAFGRNRPPIIHTQLMVKKEIELLESLSDMKDAAVIMKLENGSAKDAVHPMDQQFSALNLDEMTPLDPGSAEFLHLREYLVKTQGATHANLHYQVEAIFRVARQGEGDRLNRFAPQPQDRRLLWHGSRTTNFGGILSQGLRIAPPEAPPNGYMFGKGVYLADMSSKSANYCVASASGGTALLLLCEAELGSPMLQLTNASYRAGDEAKTRRMLATWGQGNTGPRRWKDAGCVHPSLEGVTMPDTAVEPGPTGVAGASLYYNEYICYDSAQVRLRYLFRVRM